MRSFHHRSQRTVLLLASVAVLAGAGCLRFKPTVDTVRHYALQTSPPETSGDEAAGSGIRLAIAPAVMPAYLRSSSLAVRSGDGQIQYDYDSQWAEPLDKAVTRVLAANLGSRVQPEWIGLGTWHRDTVTHELSLSFLVFDVHSTGRATLECYWRVTRPSDRKTLVSGHSSAQRVVGGGTITPEDSVAALSSLLAELSDQIATSMTQTAP